MSAFRLTPEQVEKLEQFIADGRELSAMALGKKYGLGGTGTSTRAIVTHVHTALRRLGIAAGRNYQGGNLLTADELDEFRAWKASRANGNAGASS